MNQKTGNNKNATLVLLLWLAACGSDDKPPLEPPPEPFQNLTQLDVSKAVSQISVIDLNNDDLPDLLLLDSNVDKAIAVFLNQGDRTFSSANSLILGKYADHMAIGDVNNDGKLDIVVEVTDHISVFLGDGTGKFATNIDFTTSGCAPKLADVNADHFLDIVVAGCVGGTGHIGVLLGDGTGHFADEVTYPTANSTFEVNVGDMNEDGKLDVLASNGGCFSSFWSLDGLVNVMEGDGLGGFTQRGEFPNTGDLTGLYPQLVDLNQDSHLDTLVRPFNPCPFANIFTFCGGSTDLEMRAGNGKGSFGEIQTISVSGSANDLSIQDMNSDGVMDILTAGCETATIYYGDGNGGFSNPVSFEGPDDISHIAAGDFDNDGKMDVVVTVRSLGKADIFYQQ